MSHQIKRIIIEMVLGIVLSVVLSCILIFVGYANIHMSNASALNVNFFGHTLYHITKSGNQFNGSASNTNMMFLGVIISSLLVIIGETFFSMKGKKKK
ncbi:hypothetical protein EWI07_08180 [Sporolactobacillus sp. THM7-4]|nr:hypothetical protein EWI07_08180 [Sporolactobacillus sp. THM7-4]